MQYNKKKTPDNQMIIRHFGGMDGVFNLWRNLRFNHPMSLCVKEFCFAADVCFRFGYAVVTIFAVNVPQMPFIWLRLNSTGSFTAEYGC
jgi:hypothetical protein